MNWRGHRYELLTATAPGFCDATCGAAPTGDPAAPLHSSSCRARCRSWSKLAPRRWNHLRTLQRRYFPTADVEYFKVAELQKRDALHYHVIVRSRGFAIPVVAWRRLLMRAGFGPVMDLRRADAGAVWYLAKYLLKDIGSTPGRVWSWSSRWALHGPEALEDEARGWQSRPRPEGPSRWAFVGIASGP